VILVGVYIFGDLENYGHSFLSLFIPDDHVYKGLGFVFWLVVFFLTGVLLKKTSAGNLLSGIPIIGMFFRRSGNVISIDMLINMTPCLFLLSPTCISYGWVLSEEKVKVKNERVDFRLVNVYYANVPTIITGQVFSVRKETVMKLGNPSREIIDILLYGLRRPEYLQYLPWEDETEEEFKERAKRFGLI
jgi:uncharacterized membrane protein